MSWFSTTKGRGRYSAAIAAYTAVITTTSLANAIVGQANPIALTATGIAGTPLWSLDYCWPNESLLIYTDAAGNLQWDCPQTLDACTLILRVTDSVNPTNTAIRTLTWTSTTSGAFTAVTTTLPNAATGAYYCQRALFKGGSPPYVIGYSRTNAQATANAGNNTTLTDATQSWTTNQWAGYTVISYGCIGTITSNTATTLTFTGGYGGGWNQNAGIGTQYSILMPQPTQVTQDGYIESTPVTTGTTTLSGLQATDSAGASISLSSLSFTTAAGSLLAGVDPFTGKIFWPKGVAGNAWSHQIYSYGGSGNITISGAPAGMSCTVGGQVTWTSPTVGTYAITVTQGGLSAVALISITPSQNVARPSYNLSSSNGPFIMNGKMYDKVGEWIQGYGTNRLHWNSNYPPSAFGTNGALSAPTMVRHWPELDGSQSISDMVTQLTNEYLNNGIMPILTIAGVANIFVASCSGTNQMVVTSVTAADGANCGYLVCDINNQHGMTFTGTGVTGAPMILSGPPGGGVGTYTLSSVQTFSSQTLTGNSGTAGNTDPNCILGVANLLTYAYAHGLSAIQNQLVINVNEWGGNQGSPITYSTWQSVWTTFIATLRTAGFTCPITFPVLQFGEDFGTITGGYAAAVLATDPLLNTGFDFHLYGSTNNVGYISSITKANPCVVTLSSNAVTHPMEFSSDTGVFSGIQGMTQLNGQTVAWTAIGGSAGAWTLTLSLDSSAYSTYTGGGTVLEGRHYTVRAQQLAAFIASGLFCFVGEFGPPGGGINADECSIGQFIAAFYSLGIFINYWAIDDINRSGNQCDWYMGAWFGETAPYASSFTNNQYAPGTPSSLTGNGMDTILHPRYGRQALGRPVSSF